MRFSVMLAVALVACQSSKDDVEPADGVTDPTTGEASDTTDVVTDTEDTTTDTGTTDTEDTSDTELPPIDTALPGDPFDLQLDAPATVDNGRFVTSNLCADCHDNVSTSTAMRDEDDRPIAPYDLWASSMMANSGRDPLWRAQMSAEIAATPAAEAAIGAKCTRCHAPMASEDAALTGSPALTADVITAGGQPTDLALDGVSCALCHQIESDGLGEEASFGGGYATAGTTTIYGPHASPFANPMEMHVGYTPTESGHVMRSELCATCHTLTTHALDAAGTETGGQVVEQAPYLEQIVSDYVNDSCQNCHLPKNSVDGVPISTEIAHNPQGQNFPPISDRSPYGRHVLVGGNTLIPGILRDWAAVLQPRASAAAFDATIEAARAQLAERTGTVAVEALTLDGDELRFDAVVTSMVGHKLPTGIPVRRVWLRTQVTDATGAVVFAHGGWDDAGRIVDTSGAPLAYESVGGPVFPHVDQVDGEEDVVVYEGIMADVDGNPTWRLLRGEGWVKDNRLLPAGFDRTQAAALGIDAVGLGADVDFVGGSDRVHYTLDVAGATAPLSVEVELVYQPLSARWAEELFASGTSEALEFQVMYAAAERTPERIALTQQSTP